MNTFTEQLQQTRQNLERLENLHAKHPDVFEHASLIEISPDHSRVYIHASMDRARNWRTWAAHVPANWRRESSASCYEYYDYRGNLDGVEISILQAEQKEEPQPLFAEEASATP